MKQDNLEFIGDRIFSMAAVFLVEKEFPKCSPLQFTTRCTALTTNANFKNVLFRGPGKRAVCPNKVEWYIGSVYKEKGFDRAVLEATALLRTTHAFSEINADKNENLW